MLSHGFTPAVASICAISSRYGRTRWSGRALIGSMSASIPCCFTLMHWINSTFGWSPPWRLPLITKAAPRKIARKFNWLQIGGVHNDYQQCRIRPT